MTADLGLGLLRIVVGVIAVAHGLQKFGYLGGSGIEKTGAGFEANLGFRPGWLWAWVVALTEVVGGALMIIGFLGFIAPFAIAADMVVAALTVHGPNGFWNAKGGYEFNLLLGGAAVASGLLGFGAWSVDGLIGLALPSWMLVGWAVLTVIGIVAAFATREIEAHTAA